MSRKKKGSVPVVMPKAEDNVVFRMTGKDIVKEVAGGVAAEAPRFRTGAHMGPKDRPRDKNWRKWTEE